jgi:hypothetical protein
VVPQRHTRDTRSPGPAAGSVDDGAAGRAQLRAYDRIVLGMDPGTVLGSASAPPPRPAPRASGLFGLLWC